MCSNSWERGHHLRKRNKKKETPEKGSLQEAQIVHVYNSWPRIRSSRLSVSNESTKWSSCSFIWKAFMTFNFLTYLINECHCVLGSESLLNTLHLLLVQTENMCYYLPWMKHIGIRAMLQDNKGSHVEELFLKQTMFKGREQWSLYLNSLKVMNRVIPTTF